MPRGNEAGLLNINHAQMVASFPGFPSSFPSLAVPVLQATESWKGSDGKLEGKPGNEATQMGWVGNMPQSQDSPDY